MADRVWNAGRWELVFMSTKERGVLTKWDDAKGFGFIKPSNSAGPEIFIHVSEIKKGMSRRPLPGDLVHYQAARDARTGKPRACDAFLVCVSGSEEKRNFRNGGGCKVDFFEKCDFVLVFSLSP